jgi:hypothetical protein
LLVIPPEVAVIWVAPVVRVETRPLLVTVATAVWDERQVDAFVTSHIPPPKTVAVALNCTGVPTVTL